MIVIAHAAHWWLSMLEATPVAIVLAVVGWKYHSDRRAAATAVNGARA